MSNNIRPPEVSLLKDRLLSLKMTKRMIQSETPTNENQGLFVLPTTLDTKSTALVFCTKFGGGNESGLMLAGPNRFKTIKQEAIHQEPDAEFDTTKLLIAAMNLRDLMDMDK